MSAFFFYRGVVQQGRLHEFVRGVKALQQYRKEREVEADPEHARINNALPWVEGSIQYEIYLDDRFGTPVLGEER